MTIKIEVVVRVTTEAGTREGTSFVEFEGPPSAAADLSTETMAEWCVDELTESLIFGDAEKPS